MLFPAIFPGMKIYTRTGDDGTTGLFGGERVGKDDPRIDCYGTVDELNAAVGVAISGIPTPLEAELTPRLRAVQNELFVIGAHLATPPASRAASRLPPLEKGSVDRLEREIDAAEAELPALRNFILPGGGATAARLHLARTICRRAERLLVAFERHAAGAETPHPLILIYVNRLSDWLFVQARWANHREGVADIPWSV